MAKKKVVKKEVVAEAVATPEVSKTVVTPKGKVVKEKPKGLPHKFIY